MQYVEKDGNGLHQKMEKTCVRK